MSQEISKDELRKALAFLAAEPGCETLIRELVEAAKRTVRGESGDLEISLGDDQRVWTLFAPGTPIDARAPEEMKRLWTHTGGSFIGEPGTYSGVEMHGGFNGILHALGPDLGLKETRDGFVYRAALCAPIDVGLSRCFIYHPETGRLHEFDQDGGLTHEPEIGVGAAFLREVQYALDV